MRRLFTALMATTVLVGVAHAQTDSLARKRVTVRGNVALRYYPSDAAPAIDYLAAGTPLTLADSNALVHRDSGSAVVLGDAQMRTKGAEVIAPGGVVLKILVDTGETPKVVFHLWNFDFSGWMSRSTFDTPLAKAEDWVKVVTAAGDVGFVRADLVKSAK